MEILGDSLKQTCTITFPNKLRQSLTHQQIWQRPDPNRWYRGLHNVVRPWSTERADYGHLGKDWQNRCDCRPDRTGAFLKPDIGDWCWDLSVVNLPNTTGKCVQWYQTNGSCRILVRQAVFSQICAHYSVTLRLNFKPWNSSRLRSGGRTSSLKTLIGPDSKDQSVTDIIKIGQWLAMDQNLLDGPLLVRSSDWRNMPNLS